MQGKVLSDGDKGWGLCVLMGVDDGAKDSQ
ncbi:hypothetical protein A2U01_0096217, partial [Trifolium medium]|nr:hypothetical protein [Trifolium medium]